MSDVVHGTAEYNFNLFHSSAHIAVECAFGEIELRWTNLWCPLQCYNVRWHTTAKL
jgi:hypothetical protein